MASGAVYHHVEKGQNLYRIARTYGVTLSDLCRANGIDDSTKVETGRVLLIPGVLAKESPEEDEPAPGKRASTASLKNSEPYGPDQAPLGVQYNFLPPDDPFSWPVDGGAVFSGFGLRGGRLHAGVDIPAPNGSAVHASRDGVVIYSGNGFRGYGNVVMLDHEDGFVTVYAHNSRNLVHVGDRVDRGQRIAKVGATGNARGCHCHFEIRRGQVAVDPLQYLTSTESEATLARAGASTHASARASRAGIEAEVAPIP